MLHYCWKCGENKESKDPKNAKILSKHVVCDSKKLRLMKEQEARARLLSCLGLKTPLGKISV